jgi:hypothetical protein
MSPVEPYTDCRKARIECGKYHIRCASVEYIELLNAAFENCLIKDGKFCGSGESVLIQTKR